MTSTLSSVLTIPLFSYRVFYLYQQLQGFIDYKVWIPDGVTVDLIEQQLIKDGIQEVAALVDPCKSTYMAYACSSAFPRPVITGQSKHLVLVHTPFFTFWGVCTWGWKSYFRQILLSNLLTSLEEVGGLSEIWSIKCKVLSLFSFLPP
jgi:hypothetical protein